MAIYETWMHNGLQIQAFTYVRIGACFKGIGSNKYMVGKAIFQITCLWINCYGSA